MSQKTFIAFIALLAFIAFVEFIGFIASLRLRVFVSFGLSVVVVLSAYRLLPTPYWLFLSPDSWLLYLWGHPSERPRPKQLNIPNQFREHNLWMMLERGLGQWTETGSGVVIEAWPKRIPESGGVCIYEGRLKDLAHEVKKEIPIKAVIGSVPRPNQAFWTLSALWAGWLWGREAVEPYKIALRRRRSDWAWNATALHAAFSHFV